MHEIPTYTLLLWITGVLILSFDIVVYCKSQDLSAKLFTVFSSLVAIWSISYGFLISSDSQELPYLLIRINHVLGMVATLGFIIFSYSYPDNKQPNIFISITLTIIGGIFIYLFFVTNLMIPGMIQLSTPDHWGWIIGKMYFIFVLSFNFFWILILYNIFRNIHKQVEISYKRNQLFMFWGLALGIIPPAILNIIFPFLGIYGFSWTGPLASAIWIYIIGYSIIRYRQMNVRVVITEVLAIAMTVIFFINIFIQAQFGLWENIVTFLVFLILGIFLIRGVLTESKQKEELRILNETLEQKVSEQTLEIRKAFDLEKKARRDLEKLNDTKDQFIMITQHSLRSPLFAIQNGLRTIQNTTNQDKETISAIKRVKLGLDRLNRVTEDFLAISAIKVGDNILTITETSLKEIISKILTELSYEIEQKELKIKYSFYDKDWPILSIDFSKIYDAILIVIENAVKYNILHGHIEIITQIQDDLFIIKIIDTGAGISKIDMEKISHNLFHRSEIARKLNPIGMGVGLSIARRVINAHRGELTIDSRGENAGSTVTISLPLHR